MNEMMKNTTNENIDLKQIENIVGQTAMNVNGISKQMGIIATAVDSMRTDIGGLKDRMDYLELNEEITTTQQETIIELARKRVLEIIGDDPLEVKKYFKIFIQRLYKDTRQNAGLGSKIARTKKCDYQRCIDYIEAWIPSCGCAELRAKARLEAKKLGYVA